MSFLWKYPSETTTVLRILLMLKWNNCFLDLELFYRYFETSIAGGLIKVKLVALSLWRTLARSELMRRTECYQNTATTESAKRHLYFNQLAHILLWVWIQCALFILSLSYIILVDHQLVSFYFPEKITQSHSMMNTLKQLQSISFH